MTSTSFQGSCLNRHIKWQYTLQTRIDGAKPSPEGKKFIPKFVQMPLQLIKSEGVFFLSVVCLCNSNILINIVILCLFQCELQKGCKDRLGSCLRHNHYWDFIAVGPHVCTEFCISFPPKVLSVSLPLRRIQCCVG